MFRLIRFFFLMLQAATIPSSAIALLQALIKFDPDSRVTAHDALKHKFFLETSDAPILPKGNADPVITFAENPLDCRSPLGLRSPSFSDATGQKKRTYSEKNSDLLQATLSRPSCESGIDASLMAAADIAARDTRWIGDLDNDAVRYGITVASLESEMGNRLWGLVSPHPRAD